MKENSICWHHDHEPGELCRGLDASSLDHFQERCTWRAKPGPRPRRIERSLFDGVEGNGGVSLNSEPQATRSISQRPRETLGEHRPLSRKKSKVSALCSCLVYISTDDSISNEMNV